MRTFLYLAVLALTLSGMVEPAAAKGCIKGAIVGGAAGHYAGHHGVLGAAAGCIIGRHRANKRVHETASRQYAPSGRDQYR
jgi:hypothetical protein